MCYEKNLNPPHNITLLFYQCRRSEHLLNRLYTDFSIIVGHCRARLYLFMIHYNSAYIFNMVFTKNTMGHG